MLFEDLSLGCQNLNGRLKIDESRGLLDGNAKLAQIPKLAEIVFLEAELFSVLQDKKGHVHLRLPNIHDLVELPDVFLDLHQSGVGFVVCQVQVDQ